MKKILTVLLALLVLAGCGKGYSQLSDGNEVIYTGPNGDFTKNDLYKSLKISSEDAVESDLTYKVAELENVDFEALNTKADEMVQMYEQMGYDYYLIANYGSLDAFKSVYVYSLIPNELSQIYLDENFDSFVEKDSPVQMQLAEFDSKETAGKVIDEVKAGATFDMACANNGLTDAVTSQVYTNSSLDTYVLEYLRDTTENGISKVIESYATEQDSDGNYIDTYKYYVCNIISRDVNDFAEAYKELKNESLDETTVISYFFEKHDIQFYDQDIYEIMKASYEVLE